MSDATEETGLFACVGVGVPESFGALKNPARSPLPLVRPFGLLELVNFPHTDDFAGHLAMGRPPNHGPEALSRSILRRRDRLSLLTKQARWAESLHRPSVGGDQRRLAQIQTCINPNSSTTLTHPAGLVSVWAVCVKNCQMDNLLNSSVAYSSLGLVRGDLQWIEVKRPLPKRGKPLARRSSPQALNHIHRFRTPRYRRKAMSESASLSSCQTSGGLIQLGERESLCSAFHSSRSHKPGHGTYRPLYVVRGGHSIAKG
jgi:hypothetical protein